MVSAFGDEAISRRLRFLIDEADLTMKEVAEAIDVPYRTLQNQLSGNNKMPASTLAKIVTMLEVPLSFVTSARVVMSRRSLTSAIKDVLGRQIPVLDGEMRLCPPDLPDERDQQRLDADAGYLAALLIERYEWHLVDPRLIGHDPSDPSPAAL